MSAAAVAPRVWRYSEPSRNHEGWWIAFFDDAGCVSVQSDFGDYSHRWPMGGMPERDGVRLGLREFILTTDSDYVLRKFSSRSEFDAERSLAAVRRRIIEERKDGRMSAEEARAEWETANTYLRGARRGDEWICHTSLEEPWNELSDRYPRQATAFMEKIWPRVLAAVRADLQAPASTVATNEPGSYPRATDAQIRAMAIRRARFAELVEQERKRQDEKWGKNIVPLDRMLVVLGEEFGEACRGALELAKPGGFENLQDELVQVGAVASKIYELLLILDLARVDENLERRARGGGA